ncbi:unnamed protein product [Boreogadus saida]
MWPSSTADCTHTAADCTNKSVQLSLLLWARAACQRLWSTRPGLYPATPCMGVAGCFAHGVTTVETVLHAT